VTVRSQTRWPTTLNAQHTAPNSVIAPNDAIRFFGLYRVADALQSCALTGVGCDTDLRFMGNWSDGQPVTPAVSTDQPTDLGPTGVFSDCRATQNPRAATCDG
jgi:hypothetical protein